MMRHIFPGMGLAVALLLGHVTTTSYAQEGERSALHSFNGPNNSHGPACAGDVPPRGWYPGRYILCDPLNRPSLIRCVFPPETNCCWASSNTMGCGNLKTDFLFAFGSCRQFYGEPCLNGPPPPVAPPGS